MIHYITEEIFKKYIKSNAINQSILKKLLYDIDGFINKKPFKPTIHMENGSILDTLILEEEKTFYKKYMTYDHIDITGSEKKIVEDVYNTIRKKEKYVYLDISKYDNVIEDAIHFNEWQSKWKIETRINKIITNGQEYFKLLAESNGKTIIEKQRMKHLLKCADLFKSENPIGRFIESDKSAVYYQKPLYFYYRNFECKGLLDILIVNENEITIIDLKTMSDHVGNFSFSFNKFRYDIQLAWYREAVRYHRRKNPNIKINCYCIVLSVKYPDVAIYEVKENTLERGLNGDRWNKGFTQLFDEYVFYLENGFYRDYRVNEQRKKNQFIKI